MEETLDEGKSHGMSRLRGDEEGGHEDHPVGDAGLALHLLGLSERFAGATLGCRSVRSSETPRPPWVWAVPVRAVPPLARPQASRSGAVTKVFTSLLLADAVYGAGVLGEAMARACGSSYTKLLSSRMFDLSARSFAHLM